MEDTHPEVPKVKPTAAKSKPSKAAAKSKPKGRPSASSTKKTKKGQLKTTDKKKKDKRQNKSKKDMSQKKNGTENTDEKKETKKLKKKDADNGEVETPATELYEEGVTRSRRKPINAPLQPVGFDGNARAASKKDTEAKKDAQETPAKKTQKPVETTPSMSQSVNDSQWFHGCID